ncbi:hypothetical protein [Teredinibacter purpureus]|jgi:hypothetical protein|uniref:hypothetical protein n=1 Tax=Teredinibacter purpureus TaxID=2731756 RepID=UPI0013C4999D|nr:hypothetical protein [Teredinibacter purpureus]
MRVVQSASFRVSPKEGQREYGAVASSLWDVVVSDDWVVFNAAMSSVAFAQGVP